ncbi:protein SCAI-like isoform X1 [Sycon ciliatum]|uniref:protein SCAI-like isoform X1 n=1 Tax=Sycon ciliatum TaxID=27933 RepID=UPI0031F6880C
MAGLAGTDTISFRDDPVALEEVLAGHDLVRSRSDVAARYQTLYESAMKHFSAMKEVNKFGRHDWRSVFGETFRVFAELWEYLKENMVSLRHSGLLQSYRTADVASKIGQMFYHSYVLSSDVEYLHQAYWFYSAVRYSSSSTDTDTSELHSSHLLLMRMRYLARFLSVALLLGRSRVLSELVEKLEKQVTIYNTLYPGSQDASDWHNTAVEARSMLEALELVQVPSRDMLLEHRLVLTPHYVRAAGSLSLDEAILVSCTHRQARFSQLTLDMLRMVYTLELQTTDRHAPPHVKFEQAGLPPRVVGHDRRPVVNPRKCLLHRPSVPELLAELSIIMKDVSPNGITLLYFSCNSTRSFDRSSNAPSTPTRSRDVGHPPVGLSLRSTAGNSSAPEDNLYPSDLTVFTRKPLFLIIDSDQTSTFEAVKSPFHQPFVSLLAASRLPEDFSDYQLNGRLLTLFLTCPLTAFCHVCNLVDVTESLWTAACRAMTAAASTILDCLRASSQLDADLCLFLDDFFTRTLVCRFVFCQVVFRHHYAFPSTQYWPTSCPPIPGELLSTERLHLALMSVADSLDVRQLFE